MSVRVAFSIPIHERLEVVKNQIENFKYFNPNCIIILHASLLLEIETKKIEESLSEYDFVFINPVRILTGFADSSQLYTHYINLKYLLDNNISFDYFCLHASNDMYVKAGFEQYVQSYSSLCFTNKYNRKEKKWLHAEIGYFDNRLKQIRNKIGQPDIYISQVEGVCFSAELAKKFESYIHPYFKEDKYSEKVKYFKKIGFKIWKHSYILQPFLGKLYYCTEEIYPATILQKISPQNGSPCVYLNWNKNLIVTQEDIQNIRDGKYKELEYTNTIDTMVFFAVKRINRDMEDPIRKYITFNLMNTTK